ncbi:MAG: YihY/virulence factor BrkB family protein, partial [Alphaproteobacteria bacterium]|nr:YihY/virulence factor BrkB family protein [Alphaproteobacteria bacterium]
MNISSESEKSRPTSFITVLQLAGTRFVAHDGFALAGYIAFVGILSLFPFLFFLAALFGFFGVTEPGTYFAAFLFHNIPEAVAESLETPLAEIFQNTYGNLLTISMLGALWTAGTGLEGVRTALNRALNVDRKRAYWRRRGQGAAILTVMAGGLTLIL